MLSAKKNTSILVASQDLTQPFYPTINRRQILVSATPHSDIERD